MRDDFKRYEKECFVKITIMDIKEFKKSLNCDNEIETAIEELEKFVNSLDFDNLPKNVRILDANSKPGKESVVLFISGFESPLNTIMNSLISQWLRKHDDRRIERKAYVKHMYVLKSFGFGKLPFDAKVKLDLSLL